MKIDLTGSVFRAVADASEKLNLRSYVIGGYVRDVLLRRQLHDIDILVLGSGITLAREVAHILGNETKVTFFKNFGTAMLQAGPVEVEFVGARKESYRDDSRKPLVEDGTFQDDLNRRDFTINTLAVQLHPASDHSVIDVFGGLEDLENKVIKTPMEPERVYSDDPLRMMRAVRFASQLHFTIESASFAAIVKNCSRISIVSQERITTELNKIILSPKPSVGFKLLFDSGLLAIIFPQLVALQGVEVIKGRSHKDNFYHTLEVLDNISEATEDLYLRWAALLHDIAKPLTKRFDPKAGWTFHGHEDKGARMVPTIFSQLKLPAGEPMRYVQKLVLLHLRPIVLAQSVVTDSAVRRLLFEAGDDIDGLMKLCHADVTTKNEYKAKKYRANFELVKSKLVDVEVRDQIRNWQPPVTGNDIMEAFHIPAGKEVGILKNMLREAILEGIIPNDREQAFQYIIEKGLELGLSV